MLLSMNPTDNYTSATTVTFASALASPPQPAHFVSPSSSGASSHYGLPALSIKRGRVGESDSESDSAVYYPPALPQQHAVAAAPQPSQKRARPNAYIAPQPDHKNFLSTMGSLASAPVTGAAVPGMRVHFRRQLSGGKLESFLGAGDDSMDVDMAETRPRSMSF